MPRIASIRPIGPEVYAVTQDATHPACLPEVHTVNLRAFGWNGSCTCDVFTCCAMFLIQMNPQNRQRCIHLEAVREWVMENQYPQMVENNIVVLPDYESEKMADVADTVQ